MNKWSISRYHSMPLYQKIMLLTEEKIKSGELKPGIRLPAERKLAEYLKVNRSTVIRAMEELTAQGVLTRKKGSGTYVNPDKWGLQTKPLINWGTSLTTDSFKKKSDYQQAVARFREQKQDKVIDLSNGNLPADLLP